MVREGWLFMAGSGSSASVAARKRARDARIKLDAQRVARDERIEAAAAEFFTCGDELTKTVERLERSMGGALARLLGEGETVERVAALCDVSSEDVRRLSKLASVKRAKGSTSPDAGAQASGDNAVNFEDGASADDPHAA